MVRRRSLVGTVLLGLVTALLVAIPTRPALAAAEVNWGDLNPEAPYVDAVDPGTTIDVYINLKGPVDPEVAALDYVVPDEPKYREWLTLEQAKTTFGADQTTKNAILAEVNSAGGTVVFGPSDTYAVLSLTVASATTLFGVEFGLFGAAPCTFGCVGAPMSQPQLPVSWAGLVDAVAGLVFVPPQSARSSDSPTRPLSSTLATPTRTGTPSGCPAGIAAGGFTPSQLNTAYGIDDAQALELTGAGVRLAVLQLNANVLQSDLDAFTTCFDLPQVTVRQVNSGGPTTPNPDWAEATLDVQVVAQVASGLEAFDLYSYNGNPTAPRANFLEMLALPINPEVYGDAPPDIVSVSYALCEADAWEFFTPVVEITERMLASVATTGMSYLVASGDSGSSGCLHNGIDNQEVNPTYPSTSAWVTAVGGTSLTLAADNSIAGESVWNDTLFPPPYFVQGAAGTGGTSALVERPPWQKGQGVPDSTQRTVPDVALYAGTAPGWTIYCSVDVPPCVTGGGFVKVGGTSAATPLLAGMLALLGEPVGFAGQPATGFAAPLLYAMAEQGTPALQDVITGNNAVADVDCCEATVGYDLASGWGSVNAAALISDLLGPDGPPTDLQILDGYLGSAITFNPPTSTDFSITNYEYSTDGGSTWTAFSPPTGNLVRSVVVTDLPNGVATDISLRAVNPAGPGPASRSVTANPQGAVFTPINPTRVFDSRDANAGGPLTPGQPRTVSVQTPGGVPNGAIAVAYNVTVTGTEGSGFVTVGPAGVSLADTSTINWTQPNQTLANGYVASINYSSPSTNGLVQILAQGGATDVVLDIVGYYATEAVTPRGSLFSSIAPTRVYDSRVDQGPLAGGQSRSVDISSAVPNGATAVVFNLTQTGTLGTGYLTVSPDAQSPVTSTINWTGPGQTFANSSTIGAIGDQIVVSATGQGSADFVLDIVGYYAPAGITPDGTRFTAQFPMRAYDSRTDVGIIAGGQSRTTSVAIADAKPAPMPAGIAAVAFNVTVTGTTGTGFLYVAPAGTTAVNASTINWSTPLTTRANGSVVAVNDDAVTTLAEGGSTQYLIDIAGYFN